MRKLYRSMAALGLLAAAIAFAPSHHYQSVRVIVPFAIGDATDQLWMLTLTPEQLAVVCAV